MAKNVLIFSDGTGQAGGYRFDEARTNVYKLYRATRCGPDTDVDPALQVAFYDPGLGSQADGGHLLGGIARGVYNLISQATGFGITANIVDCYAAVIRLWEPGDRIFLIGFSRGAYTARCLAEVISLCGIPKKEPDGTELPLDPASVRTVALYAVKHIYQFTAPRPPGEASKRQQTLEAARLRLAETFRTKHAAHHLQDGSTYPYFVGVFDTVAALGNIIEFSLFAVGFLAAAAIAGLVLGQLFAISWLALFAGLVGAAALVAAAIFLFTHVKADYEAPDWKTRLATLHMTDVYPRFYDHDLHEGIGYAKHAISIDEDRKAFARVPWGHRENDTKHSGHDGDHTPWFEQVWFSGNHADIGGGYPERESRLSDITLDWMLRCACEVPGGLVFDETVLRRWTSVTGPQHDEIAAGFGMLTSRFGVSWPARDRTLPPGGKAIMHPSVYDRFDADIVMHYDGMRAYRPKPLSAHPDFASHYDAPYPGPSSKVPRTFLARMPKSAVSAARPEGQTGGTAA